MFTDRFIKVPIRIYNKQQKELTGNEVCEQTYMKFNPFELSNYCQSYDDEYPEENCIHITLKNGYGALVYLTIKDFERLLNSKDA